MIDPTCNDFSGKSERPLSKRGLRLRGDEDMCCPASCPSGGPATKPVRRVRTLEHDWVGEEADEVCVHASRKHARPCQDACRCVTANEAGKGKSLPQEASRQLEARCSRKPQQPQSSLVAQSIGDKRASPGDHDDLVDCRVVREPPGDLDGRDSSSPVACREGVDDYSARDRRRAQRDRLFAANLRSTKRFRARSSCSITRRSRLVRARCFAAKRAADA